MSTLPPDLDLTVAVQDAVEAAWERRRAWNRAHGHPESPAWSELGAAQQTAERLIMIHGVLAALPHIARQGWEIGANAAMDNVLNADVGDVGGPPNPWAETLDDELRRLTE